MNPAICPVARVVAAQAGLGLASSVMFFFIGRAAGESAILAVFCVLVPTMYYAWRQASSHNATRALAHGVIKTVLTIVMMVVCIAVIGIEPIGFFVTFAIMQFGYLVRV
jgi:F0F1-type ATP synthase assembly protein I